MLEIERRALDRTARIISFGRDQGLVRQTTWKMKNWKWIWETMKGCNGDTTISSMVVELW